MTLARPHTFLTMRDQEDTTKTALAQGTHLLVELVHLSMDQGLSAQGHHVLQGQGGLLALPQLLSGEAPQPFLSAVFCSPSLHRPFCRLFAWHFCKTRQRESDQASANIRPEEEAAA